MYFFGSVLNVGCVWSTALPISCVEHVNNLMLLWFISFTCIHNLDGVHIVKKQRSALQCYCLFIAPLHFISAELIVGIVCHAWWWSWGNNVAFTTLSVYVYNACEIRFFVLNDGCLWSTILLLRKCRFRVFRDECHNFIELLCWIDHDHGYMIVLLSVFSRRWLSTVCLVGILFTLLHILLHSKFVCPPQI